MPALQLTQAMPEDAAPLAELRVAAMRDSLTRLGRFDEARARARFLTGFSSELTRHIELSGQRVGVLVLRRVEGALSLEHLYLHPDAQGRGLGSLVLERVIAEAEPQQLPIRVTALRESDANRFYLRHGFRLISESEWDNHYERPAAQPLG